MTDTVCPIYLEASLDISDYFDDVFVNKDDSIVIMTDSNVLGLYASHLQHTFEAKGFVCHIISFLAGEGSKCSVVKETLDKQLLARGITKNTYLVALGGGVVSDMVGFVAACYYRGVKLVIIPTTLLGMVDASLGGKNALNMASYGKNLIGSIYHPLAVFIVPSLLQSLPYDEYLDGVAETIKHAIIADRVLFDFLLVNRKSILDRSHLLLEQMLLMSIAVKVNIINRDLNEVSLRRSLNFGHSIGHGIEAALDFKISHGKAVAIGMVIESFISSLLGFISSEELASVVSVIKDYGLPYQLPKALDMDKFFNALSKDKKSSSKGPRYVIIAGIGQVVSFNGEYCSEVQRSTVEVALSNFSPQLL